MSRVKTRHPGIYYRLDAKERRRYIVWFKDSAGKERYETLPLGSTERDAVAYRASVHTTMNKGGLVVRSKMTVKELGAEWLDTKDVEATTRQGYEWAQSRIEKHMGNMRVSDVSTDTIARFVTGMSKSGAYKASSIQKVLTTLNQMLGYAVRRKGIIATNPMGGLLREEKPKADGKAMRILDRGEIELLLTFSAEPKARLWRFLCFTGLRISEALSLEWGDVDFEAGLVHVRGTKTDSAIRDVVLPDFLTTMLKKQRLATPPLCKYVFHAKGRQAQRRTTLRSLQRAAVRAGIGDVTQHELRHTYASILIGQGMDVTYVAHQMGHADPGVTLRTYAKLFDPKSRMVEARRKLDVAFGGV